MKLHEWLDAYGVSHKNQTNIIIHKICVPAIFWSVIALLFCIPVPSFMSNIPYFNWATLVAVLALGFYFTLGLKPFLVMFTQVFLALGSIYYFKFDNLLMLAVGVFIIAWIFQFVGHKIEGKKPSFIDDLKFLLIGPLWIMKGIFN